MYNFKYIFLLGVLSVGTLLGFSNFAMHPFHVSSTEILYGKEQTLEINTRIFTDDFEALLAQIFKTKIDLSNPKMHKEMDVLIEKYIRTVFKLQINQKTTKLNYLGYEINREATVIYLESEKMPTPKSFNIDNKIMFQLFEDQNNIIHFMVDGKRNSKQLICPEHQWNQRF